MPNNKVIKSRIPYAIGGALKNLLPMVDIMAILFVFLLIVNSLSQIISSEELEKIRQVNMLELQIKKLKEENESLKTLAEIQNSGNSNPDDNTMSIVTVSGKHNITFLKSRGSPKQSFSSLSAFESFCKNNRFSEFITIAGNADIQIGLLEEVFSIIRKYQKNTKISIGINK
ncbi:hypothetical protein ACFL6I_14365 [candidate division KSB1 bacterium]